VTDHRPGDDEYYEQDRTGLFSQGDIFRDVPLAYPTALEETEDDGEPHERAEDWLTAGKRRFLSGPLDFGPAMLITPTAPASSNASAYGSLNDVVSVSAAGPRCSRPRCIPR
jgi:hypothetical protein